MIDTLVSVLLHLPFGLMLAVVALEFFAISRRSKTADEAVILVLGVAGAGLLLAVGIAAYLAFGEGAADLPFGNVWLGLGATALAGLALGLKVLCRLKGIAAVDFGTGSRGRRAKGRSQAEQATRASIILGYRGTLAAAVLALFAGILTVKSPPPPAPVAGPKADAAPPSEAPALAEAAPAPPAPAAPEPAPTPAVAALEAHAAEMPAPPAPPAEVAAVPEPTPMTETPAEPAPEVAEAAPEAGDEPDMLASADTDTEEPAMEEAPAGETLVAKVDPAGKPEPAMVPGAPTPAKPPVPAPVTPTPTPIPTPASTAPDPKFISLVRPLFEDRCIDCHGPDKQKGDLRLDTAEGIRKGGKSGPVVVVGKPEKSSLYTLVSLPPDDDEIMPPKGQPLTEPQANYIKRWILDGARLGDGQKWPGEDQLVSMGGTGGEPLPDGLTMPDPAFLDQLRADGVEVLALPESPALLEVGLTHAERPAGQLRLEQLAPIAKNIQSLDLKKTKVSDDDLAILGDMTSLTKLNLALTKVGDPSLSHIRKLKDLEYLNLYGTEVSDRSVPYLKDLKKLTKLFLWNSKVSENGVAKLRKELPKTDISVGG